MKRRIFWILQAAVLAALALPTAGCQSSSGTTIAVTVNVDAVLLPDMVNDIHIQLSAPGRPDASGDLPAKASQTWEISVSSVPAAFEARVAATGRRVADAGASVDVVTALSDVQVVAGQRKAITLTLSAKCVGASAPVCSTTETCSVGVCVPIPGSLADGGVDGAAHQDAHPTQSDGPASGQDGRGGADGGGCTSDQSCASGSVCDLTTQTCKPKFAPGTACTATSECATGVCSSVDHVCCNSDCTGLCQSCVGSKNGGANGTCTPLPSGSNADNDCTPSSSACGATGSCDGKGACALAGPTTSCPGSSACSAGQLTTKPGTCDGSGNCVLGTATTAACPGGVACQSTTACLPSACTVDANCATGSFCDTSTNTCAVRRAMGAACSGDTQCSTGSCADGVCCSNACTGTCEACVMTKTGVADGHCAAVTQNTDPDNECTSDGTTCGHTGICDHNGGSGGGACAYAASGVSCTGTFSCSGNGVTSTTTGSCSGKGACGQSSPTSGSCGGYTCASATACGTSCTATAGCVSGYVCKAGSCAASAFATGPCVTTPDFTTAMIYAVGNDGHIHAASNGGTSWSAWSTLALDASPLDARSDLDCSANNDVTHLVATGSSPVGALMHATGAGTTFNPFFREFTAQTFTPPGASIRAYPVGNSYVIGALNAIVVFDDVQGSTYTSISPITTTTTAVNSAIDVSQVSGGGGAIRLVAGFDNTGMLQVFGNFISSAGASWAAPVTFAPPSGTSYSFSPSICVDTGAMGGSQIHLVVVAGGATWDSWSNSFSSGTFSAWQKIATQGSSAPDCAMMGDETVHVVVLSSAGHLLDLHGTGGGTWTTTDLGTF